MIEQHRGVDARRHRARRARPTSSTAQGIGRCSCDVGRQRRRSARARSSPSACSPAWSSTSPRSASSPRPSAIKPDFKKLNPLTGAQEPLRPAARLRDRQDLAKVGAVGAIVALARVPASSTSWPRWSACRRAALLPMLRLDVLHDRPARRRRLPGDRRSSTSSGSATATRSRMKMDKEEVKEEFKQQDAAGRDQDAPSAAARCELARARMMDAVPTADVVVTNPTHYSVALRYDGAQPGADRRRQGHRPPRASRSARSPRRPASRSCPTRRSPARCTPASRSASMIPEELFQAVAQLLAYVYRVARRARSDRSRRMNTAPDQAPAATPTCSPRARVVLVVVMLIIPLPPFLLDLFITLNISAALMIVVATLYVPRALDFSVVPEPPAAHHALPPGDQRLGHAPDPAARRRRPRRRGVRQLRRRRQRGRRPRDLPDPDRDPVRGRSPTAPAASPRSARASPSTPCPASRWRSTPT